MEDLKEKIKGLPHWAWGVVGIVVLVILFFLYEKSRGGTSGVPTSTTQGNSQPQTVIPSASAGAGSGGSSTNSSTDISTYSPTTEITKTTNITNIPTTTTTITKTPTTTQSYTYSGNTGIPPVNVPLFNFSNPSTGAAEGQSTTPTEATTSSTPTEATTSSQTQYQPPAQTQSSSGATGMTVSELLAQIGADASAYAGNSSGGLASPSHLNAEADRAALAAAGAGKLVYNPNLGYSQLVLPNGTKI